MPKQVVKWGKQYLLVRHPETDTHGEWFEEWPYEGRLEAFDERGKTEIRQKWLNETRGETLKVDGIPGDDTTAAYKRYQEYLKVKADGIWGPETEAAYEKDYRARNLLTREPNLEVIWSRQDENAHRPATEDPEGWVQIGIDIDRVALDQQMRYDDETVTAKTFYTDKLSRHQINELIKTLKRARNAAYGTDE